jgi:hypothetical protein
MRRLVRLVAVAVLVVASAAVPGSAAAQAPQSAATPACTLANGIQHVIYLQFDNAHLFRDRTNVPSDLEQMPNLLNFMTDNGTLSDNEHTVLISHTAAGVLSSLTGLYPDRMGMNVTNSYFYFNQAHNPAFSTAFKYWTDLVDDSTGVQDPLPNMVTSTPTGPKNAPAPWVPFTRAGCNYGAVSTANVVLENTGTGPFGDMSEVFGVGSPEWSQAVASNAAPSGTAARAKALTDYVGIAIHCAAGGGICAANAQNVANSRPDRLPDEPGGYVGFQGLFGAKYVNPAINNGNACVNNTEGQPITDPFGQCGFPGFDGALAKNTLGEVAQMQEAGVPVTFAYISDAHDNHTASFPAPFNPNFPRASGPGEADYVAQLHAYDQAFGAFFARLAADGIDKSNSLFVFTADEGDHFAGGDGVLQADGTFAWSHTNCSWTTTPACPSNQVGEVNLNVKAKLPAPVPAFQLHRDSAPAFYLNGDPARTDPTLRNFERNLIGLQAIDPYVSSSPTPVFVQMADSVEQKALHMVNADPRRTPSVTAFGNPDYFVTDAGPSCGSNPCIDYHFAYSHGDIQADIARTWLGFVGPGVKHLGRTSDVWSDHSDIRPTIMALTGLQDSYEPDGAALVDFLDTAAVSRDLRAHHESLVRLREVYKQIAAPFGAYGMDTLVASTRGIASTDESVYEGIETQIDSLTSQRDALEAQMRTALTNATFGGPLASEQHLKAMIEQGQDILAQAHALANPS